MIFAGTDCCSSSLLHSFPAVARQHRRSHSKVYLCATPPFSLRLVWRGRCSVQDPDTRASCGAGGNDRGERRRQRERRRHPSFGGVQVCYRTAHVPSWVFRDEMNEHFRVRMRSSGRVSCMHTNLPFFFARSNGRVQQFSKKKKHHYCRHKRIQYSCVGGSDRSPPSRLPGTQSGFHPPPLVPASAT